MKLNPVSVVSALASVARATTAVKRFTFEELEYEREKKKTPRTPQDNRKQLSNKHLHCRTN